VSEREKKRGKFFWCVSKKFSLLVIIIAANVWCCGRAQKAENVKECVDKAITAENDLLQAEWREMTAKKTKLLLKVMKIPTLFSLICDGCYWKNIQQA
jgi:hypothetical protein